MKHVLVTGSEGSLGTFVVKALRESGEYNLSRIRHRSPLSSEVVGWDSCYVGDLRNREFVNSVFEDGFDYVIHCAARWNGYNNDISISYDNSQMTLNLLMQDHIKSIGKFVYISSSAAPMDKKCAYGISKAFEEELVKLASKEHGFKYTIWRLFNIASPVEEYNPGSSHICTNISHKAINLHEHIDVNDMANVLVPLTWVEDVSACIVGFLNDARTDGETFNLATEELHSSRDIAMEIIIVAEEMNLIPKGSYGFEREKRRGLPDGRFDKMRNVLDWVAPTGFYGCVSKFMQMKYGQ
jgi:nucleoside-diphosphate-sugar epimerase